MSASVPKTREDCANFRNDFPAGADMVATTARLRTCSSKAKLDPWRRRFLVDFLSGGVRTQERMVRAGLSADHSSICPYCTLGEIGTVTHMMTRCPAWNYHRGPFLELFGASVFSDMGCTTRACGVFLEDVARLPSRETFLDASAALSWEDTPPFLCKPLVHDDTSIQVWHNDRVCVAIDEAARCNQDDRLKRAGAGENHSQNWHDKLHLHCQSAARAEVFALSVLVTKIVWTPTFIIMESDFGYRTFKGLLVDGRHNVLEHVDLWDAISNAVRVHGSTHFDIAWFPSHLTASQFEPNTFEATMLRLNKGADHLAVLGSRLHYWNTNLVKKVTCRRILAWQYHELAIRIQEERAVTPPLLGRRVGYSDVESDAIVCRHKAYMESRTLSAAEVDQSLLECRPDVDDPALLPDSMWISNVAGDEEDYDSWLGLDENIHTCP